MGFWWFLFVCNLLIPLAMVVTGYMMWKHAPKKINGTVGYRTTRSMRNTETWKFAQEYCGRLWWKTGWVLTVLTILAQLPFMKQDTNAVGILSLVLVSVQLFLMLLTIIPTENALKKKFDHN